jgi:hypothetical protein
VLERNQIKEHMDVTAADGQHVGTIDEIEGDRIKLTKSDSSDGQHHFLRLDDCDHVEENRLILKQGAPEPSAA